MRAHPSCTPRTHPSYLDLIVLLFLFVLFSYSSSLLPFSTPQFWNSASFLPPSQDAPHSLVIVAGYDF